MQFILNFSAFIPRTTTFSQLTVQSNSVLVPVVRPTHFFFEAIILPHFTHTVAQGTEDWSAWYITWRRNNSACQRNSRTTVVLRQVVYLCDCHWGGLQCVKVWHLLFRCKIMFTDVVCVGQCKTSTMDNPLKKRKPLLSSRVSLAFLSDDCNHTDDDEQKVAFACAMVSWTNIWGEIKDFLEHMCLT